MNVVMIDNNAPGGQINRTSSIENYPGFEHIDGPTLAYNIFTQTQSLGIPYKYGNVLEIIDMKEYKIVKTDKEEIKCSGVIVATGRKPKELDLPNERSLVGRGISWCSLCDGPLYKGQDVAIVGGGNAALEETIFLSSICSSVTLIHRRDKFKADPSFVDRILKLDNVKIKYNTVVTDLIDENNILKALKLKNTLDNKEETIEVKGFFIFIGSLPVSDMLKNTDVITDNGYIIVDRNMRTNVKGIYACGDVIKKEVYQISTAVGEGAIAALSLIKDIKE